MLEPLAEFCAAPRRSPDLLDPVTAKAIARGGNLMPHELVAAAQRAVDLARRGEWQSFGTKAVGKVRRTNL